MLKRFVNELIGLNASPNGFNPFRVIVSRDLNPRPPECKGPIDEQTWENFGSWLVNTHRKRNAKEALRYAKKYAVILEKPSMASQLLMLSKDLRRNPRQATRVKKKITNVLSILSTIGSYAKPKADLGIFSTMAERIFADLHELATSEFLWHFVIEKTEKFCIYANSIQFDFTRKELKIILPKIDISIFRAT